MISKHDEQNNFGEKKCSSSIIKQMKQQKLEDQILNLFHNNFIYYSPCF